MKDKLKNLMKEDQKRVTISARITEDQKSFLKKKNIDLSKLIRHSIEEIKKGG